MPSQMPYFLRSRTMSESSMVSSNAQRVEALRDEIRRLDRLYYVEAAPAVSDLEYDRMLGELRDLEQQSPELLTSDSPTQRIGDAPV